MNNEVERVLLKARSISNRYSLGNNEPVKLFELESLEKGILIICEKLQLSQEQKSYKQLAIKTITELKALSNDSFRSKAIGLTGQIETFINSLNK